MRGISDGPERLTIRVGATPGRMRGSLLAGCAELFYRQRASAGWQQLATLL